MKYEIVFSKAAEKDISSLASATRLDMLVTVKKELEANPYPHGKTRVKRLQGFHFTVFRLRIGDWRVIYHIDGSVIIVLRIVLRKELDRALFRL